MNEFRDFFDLVDYIRLVVVIRPEVGIQRPGERISNCFCVQDTLQGRGVSSCKDCLDAMKCLDYWSSVAQYVVRSIGLRGCNDDRTEFK